MSTLSRAAVVACVWCGISIACSSSGGSDDNAGLDAGALDGTSNTDVTSPNDTGANKDVSTIVDAPTNSDAPTSTCGAFPKDYTTGNGSVTYYTLSGSPVNCSFAVTGNNPDVVSHVYTGAGQYFGAMNTADYNNAAVCGACVEITRDNTKMVDVTIVDQCPTNSNPKCVAGHIDLSENAFTQIGTTNEGYLGTGNGGAVGVISWKYIPCPVGNADISFLLKEPANQNFNQILVESHRYPVAKVEVNINNTWTAATRESYNYWQVGNGNMGAAPYQVRATDINGAVVTASLALTAGDQTTTSQFPLCQ